jgi:hypothetical protein
MKCRTCGTRCHATRIEHDPEVGDEYNYLCYVTETISVTTLLLDIFRQLECVS